MLKVRLDLLFIQNKKIFLKKLIRKDAPNKIKSNLNFILVSVLDWQSMYFVRIGSDKQMYKDSCEKTFVEFSKIETF